MKCQQPARAAGTDPSMRAKGGARQRDETTGPNTNTGVGVSENCLAESMTNRFVVYLRPAGAR